MSEIEQMKAAEVLRKVAGNTDPIPLFELDCPICGFRLERHTWKSGKVTYKHPGFITLGPDCQNAGKRYTISFPYIITEVNDGALI